MCRVFSCVVGRGCLLWPVCSLGKTLLAFSCFIPYSPSRKSFKSDSHSFCWTLAIKPNSPKLTGKIGSGSTSRISWSTRVQRWLWRLLAISSACPDCLRCLRQQRSTLSMESSRVWARWKDGWHICFLWRLWRSSGIVRIISYPRLRKKFHQSRPFARLYVRTWFTRLNLNCVYHVRFPLPVRLEFKALQEEQPVTVESILYLQNQVRSSMPDSDISFRQNPY